MLLDLNNNFDLNKATTYFDKLLTKCAKIELKEIKPKRTIKQNSYLHVVLSLYAINYGDTLQEVKTDLKRGYGLYYQKNGNKYLKSSSSLDSKGMTEWIDWIRNKASSEGGFYIPTSEEYLTNQYGIDKEIKQNKQYIK